MEKAKIQDIIGKIQNTPIKFRAFDKERKIMIFEPEISSSIGINDELKFQEERIYMQYTGLLDKNGKEIFVGDIIKLPYYIIGDEPAYYVEKVVEFHNGVFGVWERYLDFLPLSATEKNDETSKEYISNRGTIYHKQNPTVEIIGNIFENPEILEV